MMVSKPLVKLCGWLLKDRSRNPDARDPQGRIRALAFLADVGAISYRVEHITHTFCDENQEVTGHIQLDRRGGEVTIHRIWVAKPGQGSGSKILKQVCQLADRHGVTLKLAVNPLGVAPYPMSSRQLHSWYQRNGFAGDRRMTRLPVGQPEELNTQTVRHGEEQSGTGMDLQTQTKESR